MSDSTSVPGRPVAISVDELYRRHSLRWNLASRRDDFAIWSAMRRPTRTSLIYVVSISPSELCRRLCEIDATESREP